MTHLNSRNPLLTQSTRPPYRAQFYGLNLSGPLWRNKASFTFDAEQRTIHENAFVLATTLDGDLNPLKINQALPSPAIAYHVEPAAGLRDEPQELSLTVRYQELRIGLDNQGVGDFSLASRAYDEPQPEQTVQATLTAMLSPQAINETRFQYLRSHLRDRSSDSTPAITVLGAFSGGGATVGIPARSNSNWEARPTSRCTRRRKHTFKWGGRVRQSRLADTSLQQFRGHVHLLHTGAVPADARATAGGIHRRADCGPGRGTGAIQPQRRNLPRRRVSQTDVGLFVERRLAGAPAA